MAITWGSTNLSVKRGTWKPYQASTVITEEMLLPDPASISTACSVLQQVGRGRYRIGATLMFSAMSEYTTLLSDKNAVTGRTLADGTVNATYYIETLKEPIETVAGQITADIVFVEG